MEESLQRLKKKRNKAKAGIMSDDDKIRSQLLLDTRAFADAVRFVRRLETRWILFKMVCAIYVLLPPYAPAAVTVHFIPRLKGWRWTRGPAAS